MSSDKIVRPRTKVRVGGTTHIAGKIASPAETETIESYENNIEFYTSNNFSFIPIPQESKYYSVEKDDLREIEPEQVITHITPIIDVLRLLQDYPFLLIDSEKDAEYYIYDKEQTPESASSDDEARVNFQFSNDQNEMDLDEENAEVLDADEFKEAYPDLAEQHIDSREERYGIITIADVNRRGVKEMLYPKIAEVAETIGRLIQNEYPRSQELYPQLSPQTIGIWEENRYQGIDIHISEFMTLTDMQQAIVSGSDDFVSRCGFSSKNKCREKLGSLNELRKRVMHANRTLVHSEEELTKLIKRYEMAQEIIENIDEQWTYSTTSSEGYNEIVGIASLIDAFEEKEN